VLLAAADSDEKLCCEQRQKRQPTERHELADTDDASVSPQTNRRIKNGIVVLSTEISITAVHTNVIGVIHSISSEAATNSTSHFDEDAEEECCVQDGYADHLPIVLGFKKQRPSISRFSMRSSGCTAVPNVCADENGPATRAATAIRSSAVSQLRSPPAAQKC
jgi:hypothetical protein